MITPPLILWLSVTVLVADIPKSSVIICQSEMPQQHKSWWAYRIVDGKKCWYQGQPGLSKSMLRWDPSEAPDPDPFSCCWPKLPIK